MSQSVAELRKKLVEQQLIEAAMLQKVDADTITDLTETLVDRGLLTDFQADRVLAGEIGTLTLGNYVLLKPIGAGGMGQVYLALHRQMNREVALKILPPKLTRNKEAIARFTREVEAAARLSHPNIVRAHDASESGGVHYLVMEFVPGQDLSSLVNNSGPLDVEQALDCTLQTANGLQFAHERGVIHRDIKPANLLLAEDGVVKILDMGLARFDEQDDQQGLTRTGMIMGTIDYMSPEQAIDTKSAEAVADVYSLGCTLYFLLTGQPVFKADTMMKKLLAHRSSPVPSLRDQCSAATPALDAVFQRMLAKQPDDRLLIQDVVGALQRCRDGVTEAADLGLPEFDLTNAKPLTNRPGVSTESPSRATGVRNWLIAGVGLVTVAVMVGLAFAFWPPAPSEAPNEPFANNQPAEDIPSNNTPAPPVKPVKPRQPPLELPFVAVKQPIEPALNGILPATADEPLPGLLGAPGKIPGIHRWQLQHIHAESNLVSAWSRDGSTIAVGDAGGCVRLYDTTTWELWSVLAINRSRIHALDWSLDGKLAIGTGDLLSIWAPAGESAMRCLARVKAHDSTAIGVEWSPDGQRLATHGQVDQLLKIWSPDLSLLQTLTKKEHLIPDRFVDISWSPDGQQLVATDQSLNVGIVSLEQDVPSLLLGGVKASRVDWHPKDDLIAMYSRDQPVSFYRSDGESVYESVPINKGSWVAMKWSPNGQVLALADSARLLLVSPGGSVEDVTYEIPVNARSLAWSPDSERLFSTSSTAMQVRDLKGKKGVEIRSAESASPRLASQSWRPNHDVLSIGVDQGNVIHWDLTDGSTNSTDAFDNYLHSIDWSPDATRLACISPNSNVLRLFSEDGTQIASVGGLGGVYDVDWDSTSQFVAVHGSPFVSLLDRDGNRLQKIDLSENAGIASLKWHPNEPHFVVSGGNFVHVYDAKGELKSQFKGYSNGSAAWFPDGESIVTTGNWIEATRYSLDGLAQVLYSREYYSGRGSVSVNPVDGRIASFLQVAGESMPSSRIWSPDGALLQTIPVERSSPDGEKVATWNTTGDQLAVLSGSGSANIWKGQPLQWEQTLVVDSEENAYALRRDGLNLVSGDESKFNKSFRYVVETSNGVQSTYNLDDIQKMLADNQRAVVEPRIIINSKPLTGLLSSPEALGESTDWQLVPRQRTYWGGGRLAWSFQDTIALGASSGQVQLLDAKSLTMQKQLPAGGNPVTALAWSPDGNSLVIGTDPGEVYLFHSDGRFVHLPRGHSIGVTAAAWKPDGSKFLTSGAEGGQRLIVRDLDGKELRVLSGHTRGLADVAWHPTKPLIASYSSASGGLIIHDEEGAVIQSAKQGGGFAIDWKPGEDVIYLWGREIPGGSCALMYDMNSKSFSPSSLPKAPRAVAARLSPDGKHVAIGTHKSEFYLLDMQGKEHARRQTDKPTWWVTEFSWKSNGQQIVSPFDPVVTDIKGQVVARGKTKRTNTVVDWSQDGQHIATAGSDNHVRSWNADGGSVEMLKGHAARVRSVAWSPTDLRLASLGIDGKLRVWPEGTGQAAEFDGFRILNDQDIVGESQPKEATRDLAWHPSGKLIAAAGNASSLKIVDLDSGKVRSWLMLGPIKSLAWNAAGTRLAIGCEPDLLVSWTPDDADSRFVKVKGTPHELAWQSDSEVLATGGAAQIIPIDGGKPKGLAVARNARELQRSPDGLWLAATSSHLEVLRSDGSAAATFDNPDSSAVSVRWSPDGTRIAATYYDGAMRVWGLAAGDVQWLGIPTANGNAVALSPTGTVLFGEPGDLDDTHVVLQHINNEQLKNSKPSEFLQ